MENIKCKCRPVYFKLKNVSVVMAIVESKVYVISYLIL